MTSTLLWNITGSYERGLRQLWKGGMGDALVDQPGINKIHATNEKYCRYSPFRTESGAHKSETVQSFTYLESEVNFKKDISAEIKN
jgi:hypothetical protein